jgi:hypothetical protein
VPLLKVFVADLLGVCRRSTNRMAGARYQV